MKVIVLFHLDINLKLFSISSVSLMSFIGSLNRRICLCASRDGHGERSIVMVRVDQRSR